MFIFNFDYIDFNKYHLYFKVLNFWNRKIKSNNLCESYSEKDSEFVFHHSETLIIDVTRYMFCQCLQISNINVQLKDIFHVILCQMFFSFPIKGNIKWPCFIRFNLNSVVKYFFNWLSPTIRYNVVPRDCFHCCAPDVSRKSPKCRRHSQSHYRSNK